MELQKTIENHDENSVLTIALVMSLGFIGTMHRKLPVHLPQHCSCGLNNRIETGLRTKLHREHFLQTQPQQWLTSMLKEQPMQNQRSVTNVQGFDWVVLVVSVTVSYELLLTTSNT